MAKLERNFQKEVIDRVEREFPGCLVMKNDANYRQGIPDILVLHNDKWALLEVKKDRPSQSDYQPNQEWYLEKLNNMSFASVVYPDNFEEVFDALRRTL